MSYSSDPFDIAINRISGLVAGIKTKVEKNKQTTRDLVTNWRSEFDKYTSIKDTVVPETGSFN